MKKILIALGVVVALLLVAGGYKYPETILTAGASPAGTTFNTAKFYGVAVNLASPGTNGTSTSITNTDSNDRFVTGFKVGCNAVGTSLTAYTGVGLSALTVAIGTTTTAAPASFTSFAAISTGFTLGTSTTVLAVASSTTQVATSSLASRWPSGTSMTFFFNATNTAVCTIGVDAIGS